MTRAADVRWMRLALDLGRRGLGRVCPNPAVGCVIVQGGRVVGRGWTADGGRPHAEPQALAQAGTAARGATVYVSLEPCAHHGKTRPCADALVAAGVSRVVTALEDPDARTAGAGHQRLRDDGIAVTTGICADEAARDHAGFFLRVRAGRPLVMLKLAQTIDGRIATASGESQWITGPEARRLGHALRARNDAVLVGGGTARADDPTLTVRGLGPVPQPTRVVVSASLGLPNPSNLTGSVGEAPLWLAHGPAAPGAARAAFQAAGADTFEVPFAGAGLDVRAILQELGRRGLTRVYCEGGGQLAASLLQAGLVDRLAVFTAGKMLGGDSRAAVGDLRLEHLRDAPAFTLHGTRCLGGDTVTFWDAEP